MGSLRKTEYGYRAQVRKNRINLSASFSDKETAEIWIKYQEDLIDEMKHFQVPSEKLLTLEQACELKKNQLTEKDASFRSFGDIEIVKQEFKDLLPLGLSEITHEMIKEITNSMLGGMVKMGGSVTSGDFRLTAPATVLRKLRCLSAVFGLMIEKGANLVNPVQVTINSLKMSMAKKGINEDE